MKRQLQNSPPRQNRPFEPFCHPPASSTLSSMPSAAGHGPHPRPWQTDSKSSIFLGRGVLQLPLNLSQYSHMPLFAPFSTGYSAASWPTCSSIACEAALKPVKKIIKNRHLRILG